MKIIKSADRSRVEWPTRKLIEMLNDGIINFDIDIQRGYVWKSNDKKSALIRSMILDKHIPPLFFNKVGDIYDGYDGKQRTYTIANFMNDEFELSGLGVFDVKNDDGEIEETDINGYKYSELPECFQNAIKEYSFVVCYTIDANEAEIIDTFYDLNNGDPLNSATMNRVKAKSREQINRIGKHKLFVDSLSEKAIEGHRNEDIVAKSHAILNDPNVCMDGKWMRPYMKETDITNDDEIMLNKIFDRIYNMHMMIEDKKIANRIYRQVHMVSIVPIVSESIKEGRTDEQMAKWFSEFFSGTKSATVSADYNSVATQGTGKNHAVKIRLEAIKKSYDKYFECSEQKDS